MKTLSIPQTDMVVSRIAYGCLMIGGGWNHDPLTPQIRRDAMRIIQTALDAGINFFDHADIYLYGKSEEVFADLWQEQPYLRDKIYVQSKCGIRMAGDPYPGIPQHYDFTYEHIVRSVEGSLRRLKTDYLDCLLLHRPDVLVEPEEVAKAFSDLHASGKVRYFGVSNHTPAQMDLLRAYLDQPLVFNQLEINLIHTHLLDEGIVLNQDNPARPVRGEGTLEYCRLHKITIQPWSPLAMGKLTGRKDVSLTGSQREAADLVAEMAAAKNVSPEGILIAWLLRHPALMQPIVGTTNPKRLLAACEADDIELSREEWYQLFTAGRGNPVP